MKGKRLNPRQQLFVMAFIVTGNATEAARTAGYKQTDKALCTTGQRMLGNASIVAAIDIAIDRAASQAGINPSKVVARLWHEARYYGEGSTQSARVGALKALSRILGMDRFTVTVEQGGGPPAHAAPEIRELLSALPEDKLKQFQEIMGLLAAAGKAKLIENPPQPKAIEEEAMK